MQSLFLECICFVYAKLQCNFAFLVANLNDKHTLHLCVKRAIAIDRFWLSGNLVGISINLCKSIQKELFINDTS